MGLLLLIFFFVCFFVLRNWNEEFKAGFFFVTIVFFIYFIRMQNLEAKKISDWTAKKNRIEEASRKKNEMSKEFANQARDSLNAKLENYEENREAIMSELKDKLKVIIEFFRNRCNWNQFRM